MTLPLFPPVKSFTGRQPLGLLVARCGLCKLDDGCNSKYMPVDGKGKKSILIVGESPGKTEDQVGRPFVGPAGEVLTRSLRKFGIDLREDCWVTNALRCRPANDEIKDEKCISFCRPNAIKAILDYKPEKIILLGSSAVKSVLGWTFTPEPGGITRWAGWQIPDQKLNCWICPTFHPARILHERDPRVVQLLFDRHLESALSLSGRPWGTAPDYKRQVKVILDPEEAAHHVHRMIDAERPVAWDYETNGLKPYYPWAEILSCAVSDGATSVSFPWAGAAIKAMKELLLSPVRKIGQNLAFEQIWTEKLLGVRVNNWYWDDLITSHCLDNRTGVCALDFQAYVQFGFPPWDQAVAPFMSSKSSSEPNRLKEVPISELCRYNGTDALLEFLLADRQSKELGVTL